MEIRVLGELEVTGDAGPVTLRAPKHRQLLAALVIHRGDTCSIDALIDALWGERPPGSAAALLQVYVSRLRRLLPPGATIRTQGSGYLLKLEDRSLDAERFERLLAEGQTALRDRNPMLAGSLLRRALGLWRGPAYGELAYHEFARGEAERLEELRLVALEARIEADLAAGRHAELIGELQALAQAHPLREPVHGARPRRVRDPHPCSRGYRRRETPSCLPVSDSSIRRAGGARRRCRCVAPTKRAGGRHLAGALGAVAQA